MNLIFLKFFFGATSSQYFNRIDASTRKKKKERNIFQIRVNFCSLEIVEDRYNNSAGIAGSYWRLLIRR